MKCHFPYFGWLAQKFSKMAPPHFSWNELHVGDWRNDATNKFFNKLEKKLRQAVRKIADWEQEYAEKQQALNQETLESISGHQFDELVRRYQKEPDVVAYLESVRKDLADNLDIFLDDNEEQAAIAYASLDKKMPRRYLVNVLVHQKTNEVPMVVEDNPTYHNLFGYVENVTYNKAELQTEQGRENIEARLRRAARKVCSHDASGVKARQAEQRCIAKAIADARGQLPADAGASRIARAEIAEPG